jgi:hypothetical protein
MPRDDDMFDDNFPFIRMRFAGRRLRFGGDEEDAIDMDENDSEHFEYRDVRRRVRRRLRFVRHLFSYLALNGIFVLIDWQSGGPGNGINWSQWVALIWGVFLGWEFISTFLAPALWGHEMEERLVRREMRRRRGA